MNAACKALVENKNDLLLAAEALSKLKPDLTTAILCELIATEYTTCELHDPERNA